MHTIKLTNIDFELLRKQKRCLLELSERLEQADKYSYKPEIKQDDFDTLEGMIALCDKIQDYAVDVIGLDQNDVYDLTIEEGDMVLVPDPENDDLHNHSFKGIVIGFRDRSDKKNGFVVVEDGDGNVFEIEIERLKII